MRRRIAIQSVITFPPLSASTYCIQVVTRPAWVLAHHSLRAEWWHGRGIWCLLANVGTYHNVRDLSRTAELHEIAHGRAHIIKPGNFPSSACCAVQSPTMDVLRRKARHVFDEVQRFNRLHKVTAVIFTRNQGEGGEIDIGTYEYSCMVDTATCSNILNTTGTEPSIRNAETSSPTSTRSDPVSVPPLNPAQSDTLARDTTGRNPCLQLLKLVVVSQTGNLAIGIHRESFHQLFDEYKIEPYILNLVVRNVDGFYSFPAPLPVPTTGSLSYFLHIRGWFMLIWSYELQTSKTNAILIERPSATGQLLKEITAHKTLLGHPLSLAFICCRHILDRISVEIGPELATIVDVEAKTGFNPFEGGSVDSALFLGGGRPENEDLGVLSGLMSNTSVVLALHKKYLGFTNGLLKEVTQEKLLDGGVWKKIIPQGKWTEYEELSRRLIEVSSVSTAESDMTTPYIALLRERADTQHRVVSYFFSSLHSHTTG